MEWVDIDDPERPHSPGTTDSLGVFRQGFVQGGASFSRLEGASYNQLRLIFESTDGNELDNPDNIASSPDGDIVLCEDGDLTGQRLQGLTADGKVFPLAQNNVVLHGEKNGFAGDFRGFEWAGATWSPDGKWLFANIQTPGISFAITGPWR